jgi:hypothetical protein
MLASLSYSSSDSFITALDCFIFFGSHSTNIQKVNFLNFRAVRFFDAEEMLWSKWPTLVDITIPPRTRGEGE